MAIIPCPECNKGVSDNADQCPSCGYSFRPPPLPTPAKPGKGPAVAVGCIIAAVVGVVGLAFIALLTAIAIPAFLQYRQDARRGLCINNLRLINHAKDVLAVKNNWTNGHVIADSDEAIWESLNPYIDMPVHPQCPQAPGRHYIYNPIDIPAQCPVVQDFPEHIFDPRY